MPTTERRGAFRGTVRQVLASQRRAAQALSRCPRIRVFRGDRAMRMLVGALAVILCLSSARAADVADLIKQLKDRDSDTRRSAAKALGEAGGDAKVVVPALVGALKDRDRFVRRFAAQSLGDLGPDAGAAVPALRKALDDSRKEVQEAAAAALGKIGPAAVQALIAAL